MNAIRVEIYSGITFHGFHGWQADIINPGTVSAGAGAGIFGILPAESMLSFRDGIASIGICDHPRPVILQFAVDKETQEIKFFL